MIRHDLQLRLRAYYSRLGPSTSVAVVMLMGCIIVYVFLLQPRMERAGALHAQRVPSAKEAGFVHGDGTSPDTDGDELQVFYASFPDRQRMPDLLGRIFRAAQEHGLVLDHGDYRLAMERDVKLVRYDIALPVRGAYLPLRRFLAQILLDVPSLALDSLVLTRQRINDAQIDAQIRLALYMRSGQ